MKIKKSLMTAASAGAVALGLALAAAPAGASTVIGQVYEHQFLGGSSVSFTKPATGAVCTSAKTEYEGGTRDLATYDFDEKLSSFISYSGCQTKVFEHDHFNGASVGFVPFSVYVGDVLNDEASSVWIS